ncbi:alpha/beta hydrolase [Reinekea sp.]|jgi:pimeloyl-ACP methyl ester carboxylesterase|uniref:alpha/beta fold hydrolase n=1 Tax=Reinekea sp. TaxID=1970455 RepID=UPI0025802426|nr:alpha/beta hydrolase [Reinekea sp.]
MSRVERSEQLSSEANLHDRAGTVLLLPGLLCDGTVWQDQIPALAERGIQCIVAHYEASDSIAKMAQMALAQVTGPFALAGHSMGGRVALELVRQAPQRVSRLALLDTGYQGLAAGAPGEKEVAGRMRLLNIARQHGMRVMGLDWLQGMVHPERLDDTRLCNAILDMIEGFSVERFEAQLTALITRPDATPVLAALACPTLFASGRQDSWSPLARHQAMADLVSGSRLVPIEQSGHMTTMEQPNAVSRILLDWLAG